MSESSDTMAPRPATERAAAAVDQAGERVGRWAAVIGQRLRVVTARAREEGEDILAEARSMSRRAERP